MVFEDIEGIIWNTLYFEYYRFQEEMYKKHDKLILWPEFLQNINAGIEVKGYKYNNPDHPILPIKYKIIDEKKWLLTKIKYGF